MKIRIAVPQIRCRRVTHPKTSKDEIYLAYFVSLGKPMPDSTGGYIKKHIVKRLSRVEKDVATGAVWAPVADQDDVEVAQMGAEIDTGDAKALFIVFAMYEQDDGAIYKKLLAEAQKPVSDEGFDWEAFEFPSDPTKPLDWLKSLWKALKAGITYFRQDDLMGLMPVVVELGNAQNTNWTGIRELIFKDFGGDYRVTIDLQPVEQK